MKKRAWDVKKSLKRVFDKGSFESDFQVSKIKLTTLFLCYLELVNAWILGLKCLEKSAGYSNVLDLIKHKSETEVRKQLLQDNIEGE